MAQVDFKDLDVNYESGSIETLIRLVDAEGGSTIIPEFCTLDLEEDRIDKVKFVGETNPVRQISLLVRRKGYKMRMFNALVRTIVDSIPNQIKENEGTTEVIPISS